MQRCQKEFDDISAEIKREMERFEINRAKDFKATVIKYLQDQMAHQQQVCWRFTLDDEYATFPRFRSWNIGRATCQQRKKLHENVHRLRQPARFIWAFCKYLSLYVLYAARGNFLPYQSVIYRTAFHSFRREAWMTSSDPSPEVSTLKSPISPDFY